MVKKLNDEDLKKLRGEIVLCSLYIKDYKNSFGFDPEKMCEFFDGYAEYLEMLIDWEYDGHYLFFEVLSDYDTLDTLKDYYNDLSEDELEYYFGKDTFDKVTDIAVGAGTVLTLGVVIITKMILAGQLFC